MDKPLFDSWTEKYDNWFATPVGQLVRQYESELLLQMLDPQPGEYILDAGCGTGVFTKDILECGSRVVGMDLSGPMVVRGRENLAGEEFAPLCGDMNHLPFDGDSFDRVFSMTAIEFIADATMAIRELTRVTKPGGCIVVTTLNSLSPWAERRRKKAEEGHSLFEHIYFRSPADMLALISEEAAIATAIHFQKDASVQEIPDLEEAGRKNGLETGAFLAVQWQKSL